MTRITRDDILKVELKPRLLQALKDVMVHMVFELNIVELPGMALGRDLVVCNDGNLDVGQARTWGDPHKRPSAIFKPEERPAVGANAILPALIYAVQFHLKYNSIPIANMTIGDNAKRSSTDYKSRPKVEDLLRQFMMHMLAFEDYEAIFYDGLCKHWQKTHSDWRHVDLIAIALRVPDILLPYHSRFMDDIIYKTPSAELLAERGLIEEWGSW
ncbi:MAG: hypothetical protein LPK02_07015 [Rhodobacterales bacterium]|nr:hypothetical protein [Rhodobacterales bacterium]